MKEGNEDNKEGKEGSEREDDGTHPSSLGDSAADVLLAAALRAVALLAGNGLVARVVGVGALVRNRARLLCVLGLERLRLAGADRDRLDARRRLLDRHGARADVLACEE